MLAADAPEVSRGVQILVDELDVSRLRNGAIFCGGGSSLSSLEGVRTPEPERLPER